MTLVPQRTVAGQIAAQLRAEIAQGSWRTWLPSERALTTALQTSRNTVRSALKQLEAEGVIAPTRGRGSRIISKPSVVPSATGSRKTVGISIPEPIGKLRPQIALWIDEFKDLLFVHGWRVHVHHGRQHYRAKPAPALERLVKLHAHDAWILILSSRATQAWFMQRGIPCIVAGSLYPGIELPSFDLDHRPLCRHAAGVLLRQGHRRIGMLSRELQHAGDIASEQGLLEGVQAWRHPGVSVEVMVHRDDIASVTRGLSRLIDRKDPATAILVCNSHAYLTVFALLAQRRLRVPQDLSLISRDDDSFLHFLVPAPACYGVSPHTYATKMAGLLLRLSSGHPVARLQIKMMPKFYPGASVSAPAAA